MPSVLAPYDTATGYLSTRSGVKSIGLAAGMTGATASSRYVGATSSGAPTTGTFAVGDWIIDQTGKIYVATVAGSPGTWVQVGAGGGGGASITQVTFAESTAAPNATVYVDSITAAGSTTNVDLALSPKGTGALTAQVADSTATGGNKRGAGSVDWQTTRTAATHVAFASNGVISGGQSNAISSGNANAVIGGGQINSVGGNSSVVGGGSTNTANGGWDTVAGGWTCMSGGGNGSVGGGRDNSVTAPYGTIPGGWAASSELWGKLACASGKFTTAGDAQFGLIVCRATTTTNAGVNLTNNGNGTFSATNHLVLPNNRVYRFTIDLVASSGTIGTASTSTYGSFGGVWTITGAIRRAATAATTAIIGIPTVLATAVDSQLAAVTFTVLAETATYGSLQIVATGLASTQIHWVATIMTTEVG